MMNLTDILKGIVQDEPENKYLTLYKDLMEFYKKHVDFIPIPTP